MESKYIYNRNRLIANFLYPTFVDPRETDEGIEHHRTGNNYLTFMFMWRKEYSRMSFHKSWDSLRKILDQISWFGFEVHLVWGQEIRITPPQDEATLFDFSLSWEVEGESFAELVYSAVCYFIGQFNEQQQILKLNYYTR